MIFRQLYDAVSSTYTYLLADEESGEAVLIDTVFEKHNRDAALIRELSLTLKYTLDTHCHADHVTGAWLMKAELGSQIVMSAKAGTENLDVGVGHGDVVEFGRHKLDVRATPGHTDGCVSFVTGDQSMCFTGDALLIRGAGRTDFQQGDARLLYQSIKQQIFSLPDTCLIYPGHDYAGRTSSSVAEERANNPRVGGDANEGDFVGYMENLGLPHPKQIDVALPANLRCGKTEDGAAPVVAGWGPVVMTYAGIPEIDPTWVASHREAVHLLDVRRSEELSDEELPALEGSQLIPIDQLRKRAAEVPTDKPVVAICRSGKRSAQATVLLTKAGVDRVANLAGGLIRYHGMALP